MYCSSCGVAVAEGLSYCKNCGAKLSGAKAKDTTKSSESKSDALVSAMVAVFVCGLGAIIGLMAVMKSVLNLNMSWIIGFTCLSFLIMLRIEGVIIGLLLGRKRGRAKADDLEAAKGQATKELESSPRRVLPEPLSSVTEHTTRSFEPIFSERTSK